MFIVRFDGIFSTDVFSLLYFAWCKVRKLDPVTVAVSNIACARDRIPGEGRNGSTQIRAGRAIHT